MTQLLITGEMRSGTTFCANFINSQTEAVVYADTLISLFMEAQALGIKDIHRPLTDREKNVLLSNLNQEGKRFNIEYKIDRKEEWSWKEMFDRALLILKGNNSPSVVGIKRTREMAYLEPLLKDGVKVIYLIRDPRDVVLSARNRFSRFNLFQVINEWKASLDRGLALKSNPNFFLLRYEDLILKKEAVAKQLSAFLNIKLRTDFRVFEDGRDNQYLDNSSFDDVKILFDPNAVYRWKKNSELPEVGFCSFLLKKELAILGYDLYLDENCLSTSSEQLITQFKKSRYKAVIKSFLKKTVGKLLE